MIYQHMMYFSSPFKLNVQVILARRSTTVFISLTESELTHTVLELTHTVSLHKQF